MERVLLVNDCKFESIIMKDILKGMGYEVVITNEYDALREVRELSPGILICNLIMKSTTGNLLIEKVKLLYPDIKCYLSSSSPIKLEDYRKNKVDDVIKTPANRESFEKLFSSDKPSQVSPAVKKSIEDILKRLESRKAAAETTTAVPNSQNESGQAVKKAGEVEEIKAEKKIQFCPFCGEKLQDKGKSFAFCPFCGGKF